MKKQYFTMMQPSAPTLVTEKHLYEYIREKYANCVITEDRINDVINDLKVEQDKFLKTHRGKKVEIGWWHCPSGNGNIRVGSIYMQLVVIIKVYE